MGDRLQAENVALAIGVAIGREVAYYVADPKPPGVVHFDLDPIARLAGEGDQRSLCVLVTGSAIRVTRTWAIPAPTAADPYNLDLGKTEHEVDDVEGMKEHAAWLALATCDYGGSRVHPCGRCAGCWEARCCLLEAERPAWVRGPPPPAQTGDVLLPVRRPGTHDDVRGMRLGARTILVLDGWWFAVPAPPEGSDGPG